jgi:predicted RNA-binding protein with TRAM domain
MHSRLEVAIVTCFHIKEFSQISLPAELRWLPPSNNVYIKQFKTLSNEVRYVGEELAAVFPSAATFSPVASCSNPSEVRRMSFERRRYGDKPFEKPVEEGKEYEVDVKETSRRGEGIARVEGFVVFVPNTKPGDHIKIKVTRVGNRFATGEVVQ